MPRSTVARLAHSAVLAVVLALGACSPATTLSPNVSPETTLFVQFDPNDGVPHEVVYDVHLYWLGLDSDGFVEAYEYRLLDPARPADSAWVRTADTDRQIAVPTPTGVSTPRFEVRAIDDQGALDPTPASQQFSFTNEAPTVRITNALRSIDSSYAAVTVNWNGVDPDGAASRLQYRLWLDGNEANARVLQGNGFSLPSADFLQGGAYRSGPRRLYLQAIDAGGRASTIDSMSWYVRRPVPDTLRQRGRVLLIDDVPGAGVAQSVTDSLWVNALARNLAPGSFELLRLEFTNPFRSAIDLERVFSLYDAVFWYRGFATITTPSTVIQQYQSGIEAYLDAGGTFLFEGFASVVGEGAAGCFSPAFLTDYLDCDSLLVHPTGQGTGGAADWGISVGKVLNSSIYNAVLRQTQNYAGLRAFAVRDTNHVAVWARLGTLSQPHTVDLPVGVRAPQPAGGQAILISTALRGASGGNQGDAARFLDALIAQLPPPRPQRGSARRGRP
ncbi:MAG: hypothetical protein HOP12_14735 [Candidatus Eisenbacteria bacterium]|uniref:DUF4159 domain-containing protein n=1 Tax=Eiseniibacteriota bacterium TaxID=2212470 RepID=A0A849SI20_UNCEI|nr:hypothetical protein [Candidatus Eisenbacteria bacterium]